MYFNLVGRTLWTNTGIARVRLYRFTAVAAISSGNSGILSDNAGFVQYETPGGGLYRLTDAPTVVVRTQYMFEGDVDWTTLQQQ